MLLLFPDPSVLGWFDRSRRVTALCVVEGIAGEAMAWAMAFLPLDLTTGRPYAHEPVVDPVSVEALLRLHRSRAWRRLMWRSRCVPCGSCASGWPT